METKKKKDNNTLIIIVVVVALAAVALILLFRRNSYDSANMNYSSPYAGLIDIAGKAITSVNESLAAFQTNAYQAKLDQRQQAYDQLNRQRDRSQMYVRGF